MFILIGKATIQMNCGYYIIHRQTLLLQAIYNKNILKKEIYDFGLLHTLRILVQSSLWEESGKYVERQHFFEHIIIQYIRKSTTELLSDFSDILDSPKPQLGQNSPYNIWIFRNSSKSGIDTLINDMFPKKGRLLKQMQYYKEHTYI